MTNKDICKYFVSDFVEDVLDGNLENLKTFSFLNLKTDENKKYFNKEIDIEFKHKYGYFNIIDNRYIKRKGDFEDSDDMNIVRAINFLLYADKLPDFEFNDINWNKKNEWSKYRGETINNFRILINEKLTENGNFYYEEDFDKDFADKITDFKFNLFTIGNFMLLPNYFVGRYSLNTYKGLCMGDYSDKFFSCIKNPNLNESIFNLMEKNKFYFEKINTFEKFIEVNYLQDYIDENGNLNYDFLPYLRYWNNKNITEDYKNFIEMFMKETINKTKSRADRMIKDLEKIL